MEKFRHLIQGWLGKSLLALIILPFAFFGIEGILSQSGKEKAAIEIDGHEISKAEVAQAIESQKQRMIQGLGGKIDPSIITNDMVRPAAIESLIQRQLIVGALKAEHVAVASSTVKSYVRSYEQFHDEKGIFSQAMLERVLAQNGYTAQRFFNDVQADLSTQQFQSAIAESAFATAQEIEALTRLETQRRDFSVMKVPFDAVAKVSPVTDAQVKQYFEEHRDAYRTQQRARFQFVHLLPDDFVSTGDNVSEADISARYEKFVAAIAANEKRRASHILIEVGGKHSDKQAKELADAILADVQSGKDFAALAKDRSDDKGSASSGGDLGYAGKGVYDPAFEATLFALKSDGDVSGVVKSEFGYHIIKLTGIQSEKAPTLDAKRSDIVAELRKEHAKEQLALAIDDINRLAFESGDLTVIADKYKKSVEQSPWVTRSESHGLFSEKAVSSSAFSDGVLKEQRNGDAVTLGDGSVAIVRLSEYEAPRNQDLNEVAPMVRAATQAIESEKGAKALAEKIVAAVQGGGDISADASAYHLSWQTFAGAQRTSTTTDKQIVERAFSLPKPAEKGVSAASVVVGGAVAVVKLTSVQEGAASASEDGDKKLQLGKGIAYRNGTLDFQAYLASLRSKASIRVSE